MGAGRLSPLAPLMLTTAVGADHPCCRKPHGSLRSFSLTGTIFLSIPSHFTSINHLSCGFLTTFTEGLLQKGLHANQTSADWFHGRNVTRHGY